MKKRRLGNSGLEITTIGFGTWAHGGAGWAFSWGKQDDNESIDAIKKGLDLNINWIDTAAIYGLGHAEEIAAKAIKGIRDKVILATKCSLIWDAKRRISNCLKRQSVKQECEASLKRLKTDYIDLYQIHWPYPESDIEEGWTQIQELIHEGKVRFGGVSNFSVEHMKRIEKIAIPASLQPHYSMVHREIEKDILGYCAEKNIGIVAYSPLEVGLLTGKFSKERLNELPSDDWRKSKSPFFREPAFTINLDFVEMLKPIAKGEKMTLSQLALSWVLRKKEVTSAIVGARRPSQIEETAPAGDMELSKGGAEKIANLLSARDDSLKVIL
jgi:aryl-alcohol dehydrogenase-like predicted oxidoreductase